MPVLACTHTQHFYVLLSICTSVCTFHLQRVTETFPQVPAGGLLCRNMIITTSNPPT
jgi:hypothetical protein